MKFKSAFFLLLYYLKKIYVKLEPFIVLDHDAPAPVHYRQLHRKETCSQLPVTCRSSKPQPFFGRMDFTSPSLGMPSFFTAFTSQVSGLYGRLIVLGFCFLVFSLMLISEYA